MDIALSALQHYVFCPRQCALIHLEQIWQDNEHTVLGQLMHEQAHTRSSRTSADIKVVTDLELQCLRLGIHGRADVVEFHKQRDGWAPYPVEYKQGSSHPRKDADDVQLCAQAFCLEEMLDTGIAEGSIYYGKSRRRRIVSFDARLRKHTEEIVYAVKVMLESRLTPKPNLCQTCGACSLKNFCMPDVSGSRHPTSYIRSLCEGIE